jgi:flagellar biosynthesis protein
MKTQKAVALKYDKETQKAPKPIASGKGEVAKKIIQKAKEFDIPIFVNEALVDSLCELKIDQEIPPELYNAVVEVFVWLVKNDKKGFV